MTISDAKAKYLELLSKEATPEELEAGYLDICERTDKINISYYGPARDLTHENDPYP